jgi:hypothetical protein
MKGGSFTILLSIEDAVFSGLLNREKMGLMFALQYRRMLSLSDLGLE